jgi:hypothetical protein
VGKSARNYKKRLRERGTDINQLPDQHQVKGQVRRGGCIMRKKIASQKGAALVEFALVLPILLVLVFGIIEFGVMLYDKAVITNASREGARAGIVYSYPTKITKDEISGIVSKYCGTNLVSFGASPDPKDPIVTISGTCSKAGDNITVSIAYPYHFLVLPSFIISLAGPINLGAESVMRCE